MKKIPGTLYHIGLTNSRFDKIDLSVWYKNRLVFEKSGLTEEKIIITIQDFLEGRNLSIPRNRIEWVVKDELNDMSPISDITFIEGTVSELLGEFKKTPSTAMTKIV